MAQQHQNDLRAIQSPDYCHLSARAEWLGDLGSGQTPNRKIPAVVKCSLAASVDT